MDGVMLAEEWKENFRMGKDNFYKLCGELRPFVERKVMKHVTSGVPADLDPPVQIR